MQGLDYILGIRRHCSGEEVLLGDAIARGSCDGVLDFRQKFVEKYLIGFTPDQLGEMVEGGVNLADFTDKCVEILYADRGDTDLDMLIGKSLVEIEGGVAIDLSEMDRAPKFGMNGSEWCDVAEGPCSCGAWHK